MALQVEVAGFGLCQVSQPYSLFVVCVQQEHFEAWTVYRNYNSFVLLYQQIIQSHPDVPPLVDCELNSLSYDVLEQYRVSLDVWLQCVTSNSTILRMQTMYQFLCIDANMPPPYLEIHWRENNSGSFDEMDMDDMFEKTSDNDAYYEEEEDEVVNGDKPLATVFTQANNRANNRANTGQLRHMARSIPKEENLEDIQEMQSLSMVEAEFIYDKKDEKTLHTVDSSKPPPKKMIHLDAFKIIKVIGKGSFGKVFLVRDKSNGVLYAMKVLKKEYIIKKNQVEHTKTERSVLGYTRHPFIVGLNMAFQTADNLFFILDYCAGGELFFHLGKVGRFSEDRARFYAAQIILALEYVHQNDVIYRDLKPENVLLDQNGNVRLTDFGLSKEGVSDHSKGANSFCGTPEYIAPEVLLRQGHGRAVDWWSLGALLYEMITGIPPFYSRNRELMFEKIVNAELNFPSQVGATAKDLLSRLLVRDPQERLGSGENDASDIKKHQFFSGVDWTQISAGKMQAPWKPTVMGSLDTSQFDQEFTSMNPIVSPSVREAYFGSLDKAFEGFTFVDDSVVNLMKRGGTISKALLPSK